MLWIPITDKTPDKDQILKAAGSIGKDPNEVLGASIRFWLWAVTETHDGFLPGCTRALIDHVARMPGYAEAMIATGWLLEDARGLMIVGWEEYLGKSAKARFQAAKRQKDRRRREA